MNKISLLLLAVVTAFAFSSDALAHGRVSLKINDGIGNVPLKFKIEESVSNLMCEINRAEANNRSLDLYGMNMTQDARHQLKTLWDNVHFYCDESEIVERCLQTNRGYQVRNIPLIMSIYEQFSYDIYRGNNYYKKLEETAEEIIKQLNLDREEKRLLEKWIEYEISIMNEFVEIAFIYGICIKDGLKEEIDHFK